MSNYLIDIMTWSHSRINTFLQCPYQFYLKYIDQAEESPMFFAEYGGLIHSILAEYYSGNISSADALNDYLIRFPSEAIGSYPSDDIRLSYFRQGIECMKSLTPIDGKVLCVENELNFSIGNMPFIGFVDLVYEDADGALCIMDHKSRALRQRSNRKKPTQYDIKLQFYLRQLYLYSIPVAEKYGKFPDFLEFNCYRTGNRIKELFYSDELERTKSWVLDAIDAIKRETTWKPDLDYWKCKYLCGFYDQCEYAQVADWRQ